jgi:hypothetical protein
LKPSTMSTRPSIETGDIIAGHLPVAAARRVKQWALAHLC